MDSLSENIRNLRDIIRSSPENDLSRLQRLNRLSQLLGDRYEADSEPEDLAEAILLSEEILNTVDPEDAQLGVYQNTLAYLYAYKFEETEEPEYLDLAISLLKSAADLAGPNSVERKGRLNNLSNMYLMRFESQNGDSVEDLHASIQAGRDALLGLDLDDVERPMYLCTLSNSLGTLYEIEGSPNVLQEAIEKAQESLVSAQDESIAGFAHNLASLLHHRVERKGNEEDLEKALSYARLAVEKTPQRHMDRPMYLTGLANHLLDKFQLTGDEKSLGKSIFLYQQSSNSSSQNRSDKALAMSNLGNALADRYELKGNINDLHESIKHIRKALQLVEPTSRDRAMFLGNLCCRLTAQVEQEKDTLPADSHQDTAKIIHEAVEAGREAIGLEHTRSPNRPLYLSNLINALSVEYEITQSESLLDEAIQLGSQAQNSLESTHHSLPGIHVNLSISLELKADRTGDINILDQALKHARTAINLAGPKSQEYASWLLNLSNLLVDHFQALGDRTTLEEAIDSVRNAIRLTPPDHFRRASRMYTLASQLGVLYKITGASAALDESINTLRDAIQIACNDDIRGKCWTALCGRLASKFILSGDTDDLNGAISSSEEAMRLMPVGNEEKASTLNTINSILILRTTDENSPHLLDKAIDNGERILSMIPTGHSLRPMYLSNLGVLWYLRYSKSTDPIHLNKGISIAEEAKLLAGTSSPDYATYLSNYGKVLKLRFDEDQSPQDLHHALQAFTEALNAENSPPLERIKAGNSAGSILAQQSFWEEASNVYTKSVRLMTRLTPRSLAVEDKQYLLSEMFGLSAAAASTSLMAGHSATEAVDILETGRGVISRLSIDSQDEMEALKRKYPLYHSEYERLRNKITLEPTHQESFSHHLIFRTMNETQSHRYHDHRYNTADRIRRSLDALDAFEERIRRELKDFRYFHLTPPPEEYMKLAVRGPIVCFALTEFRCDALIITEKDVRCLPLLKMDFNNLRKAAMTMIGNDRVTNSENSYTRGPRNSTLRTTLEMLWSTIVYPVLSEVGMVSTHVDDQLPRIYWVASGFIALMPLHAAGDDLDFAMNHVVSTYIPTLKALQMSQSRKWNEIATQSPLQQLMIVAVPNAPGERPLHLEEELMDIKAVAESTRTFSIHRLDSPQKQEVIDGLPNNTMVHFACHGYADARNPSNGGLLVGENSSGGSDLLSVRDLTNSKWPNLRLAYLSACSTARNAAKNLLDENINIATTFGLIGFPHVIGTLWDADNIAATRVSKLFYEGLTSGMAIHDMEGDNLLFNDIVADSLHKAIVKVRAMNAQGSISGRRRDPTKDVLAWAPFIHVGC